MECRKNGDNSIPIKDTYIYNKMFFNITNFSYFLISSSILMCKIVLIIISKKIRMLIKGFEQVFL